MIILNYTLEVLRQGRYKDLCIRCSENKDMAVCLQAVSMISWNLPTVTYKPNYTFFEVGMGVLSTVGTQNEQVLVVI